jgi:hypothetical protein
LNNTRNIDACNCSCSSTQLRCARGELYSGHDPWLHHQSAQHIRTPCSSLSVIM